MSVDLDFEEGQSVESMRDSRPSGGWTHLACYEVSDAVENLNGFTAGWQVLEHEQPGQAGRKLTERYPFPSASHKDGGRMCRERLQITWKSAGIVAWDHVGKIILNPKDLIGMQIVAKLREEEYDYVDDKTGEKRKGYATKIDGKHIHHPFEDAVANMPKSVEMLKFAQGGPNATARGAHAPVIGKDGNGVGKDDGIDKLFDGTRGRGDEPQKEAPKDTPAKNVGNGDGGEDLNDV